MKSSAPPQEDTEHIHASAADLLHAVCEQKISIGADGRSSHLRCSGKKKKFFKVLQNSQDTPVPEETPVNFANFLRAPLLQNNSRRPLLKCGHFSNEARDIDRICCRELIPEHEGSISPSSFYRNLPGYQSHVADHLIDEYPFWFLVQLNETRRLGEYKVLSFCFWG